MEHVAYSTLLLLLLTLGLWLWQREYRARRNALAEKIAIEVEERRMFGFLHGLGEKLQEDNSPPNMHRYIVDGVAEVVGADAGILYLYDADTKRLVPTYQSPLTSPVLPKPESLLQMEAGEAADNQYRSFIRLSALKVEEGIVGQAFSGGQTIYLSSLREHSDFHDHKEHDYTETTLLTAPLVYGQKRLGVLVVTRRGRTGFSSNDQEVFSSVAEQSSFALGSAIIHGEAADKRRLERELTQASEIQKVLLPRKAPALQDFDVAAAYLPARLVSGDYYDYVKVDDERYGIVIGDVCGKGIAASLIMAMCRSSLRGRAPENLSPASVLHAVNRSIFPDIMGDMFVSLLYLILERGSSEVTIARAGHEPPLIYRKREDSTELLEIPGMAAGVDQGPVFKRSVKDHRFTMESGDVLLLYTDGISECENEEGDEFGIERLSEFLKGHAAKQAKELVKDIIAEVKAFAGGRSQIDDITLIAVEKR